MPCCSHPFFSEVSIAAILSGYAEMVKTHSSTPRKVGQTSPFPFNKSITHPQRTTLPVCGHKTGHRGKDPYEKNLRKALNLESHRGARVRKLRAWMR